MSKSGVSRNIDDYILIPNPDPHKNLGDILLLVKGSDDELYREENGVLQKD
jgi:hypothetical protein